MICIRSLTVGHEFKEYYIVGFSASDVKHGNSVGTQAALDWRSYAQAIWRDAEGLNARGVQSFIWDQSLANLRSARTSTWKP